MSTHTKGAVTLIRFDGGKVLHIRDDGSFDDVAVLALCGRAGTAIQTERDIDKDVVQLGSYRVCGPCRAKR